MVVWVKHLGWVWRALIVVGVLVVVAGVFVGAQYATAASMGGVSPEPGAFVSEPTVVVSVDVPGDSPDPDQIEFLVDGEPVPPDALEIVPGEVRSTVTLREGTHWARVTLTSSNVFSRRLVQSWDFTVDSLAPSVEVTSPSPVDSLSKPTSVVVLVFREPVEPTLVIDGTPVPLTLDGTVATGPVTVSEGTHTFAVTATDRAGNLTEDSWELVADFSAPTLSKVFWPGKHWSQSQARLVFDALDNQQDGLEVAASVNGTPVKVKSGKLSATGRRFSFESGTLPEGTHRLQIVLTDRGGNVMTHEEEILVDSTERFGARDMGLGAHGNDVETLEDILERKGLLSGEPDETFDQTTADAVVAYKKARGLEATPVIDKETLEALVGRIKIDISERKLYHYEDGELVKVYGVAIGQPRYPTPTGRYQIINKAYHPTWTPPPSPWADGLEPVPPGPGNPLGTRWMGLSAPHVGIHGTYNDGSIGTAASHGCIRMHIWDVEELFELVYVGTPVDIVR